MSNAAGRVPIRLMLHAGPLALLVLAACSDLFLRARDLEVSPNPALPGDSVSFVFRLAVLPQQNYTLVAYINDREHRSVSGFEAVDSTYVLAVGAAEDLIDQYGVGTHTAYVEVRLSERGRTARTAEVSFELQAAPAP